MSTRPDETPNEVRRPDLRASLERDLRREGRREKGDRSFWQSLGLLGSVGWSIAAATLGGALVGRWLDSRWQTGARFTLILLVAGAAAGIAIAWNMIQPRSR